MYKNKKISAIINCAGCSVRFGKNKLTTKINGEYTIVKAIRGFLLEEIDEVIVTVSEKYLDEYQQILIDEKKLPVKLVIGDSERYLSALNGIKVASGDIVMLHDGSRPFVSKKMILDLLAAAVKHSAAMLAVPATTTVKVVDDEQFITKSLLRSESWLAQTPQAFEKKLIQEAYETAIASGYKIVSDDSEVVSDFTNKKVAVVMGDETNIKITFPLDLELATIIDKNLQKDNHA
jgi:2-C-methyl-D-erythritol 4-phosphate cytidylyltransferase